MVLFWTLLTCFVIGWASAINHHLPRRLGLPMGGLNAVAALTGWMMAGAGSAYAARITLALLAAYLARTLGTALLRDQVARHD